MINSKILIFVSLLLFSLGFISALESYEVSIPQTPGLIWTNQDVGANCEFINSSTFGQYDPMNTPVSVAAANKSYLDKFFDLYNYEGRTTPSWRGWTTERIYYTWASGCFISGSNWAVPDKNTWQKVFSSGFDNGVSTLGLKNNQRYWASNLVSMGNVNGRVQLYLNGYLKNITSAMGPDSISFQGGQKYPVCRSSLIDSAKAYSTLDSMRSILPSSNIPLNLSCLLALYRYVRCENENVPQCINGSTYTICSKGIFNNVDCNPNEYCSEGKCKCNTTINKCTGLQTFSSCNLSSGNFVESSCDSNQQCLGNGECTRTCAIQGGNICNDEQRCDGTQINAEDSNRCCGGSCIAPAPKNCNQCGEGLFNLFCDKTECENLVQNPGEGCVFIGNAVSGICKSATACTGAECDGKPVCSRGECKDITYVSSCRDLTKDNTYYILNNSLDAQSHEDWTSFSSCMDITESGKYYLTQNIDYATPFCLNITANEVSVDLNGKNITGGNEEKSLYPFNVIKTCQDLQNINLDLNANYFLVNDIDCTGFAFQAIGEYFYGTLDGFGHRISNLDISSGTWGGAFISNLYGSLKNIRFEGNIILGNTYNSYGLVNSNGGLVSNVYVNLSNVARRGFIRSNWGTVENTYVNMNLPSNLGGLVERNEFYNTGGIIRNSYSANGGLVGMDKCNCLGWGRGYIYNSSYGGSGNCLGSGSLNGCTLQVLPAPKYDPQNMENYATLNSAILINGVDKVSLRNLGNITGFARKVSSFKSNFLLKNYSFPSPDLNFKFDTTLHTMGYVPAEITTNITLIQPSSNVDWGYYGVASSADGERLTVGAYLKLFTSEDFGNTMILSLDKPEGDLDKNYASSADGKNLFVRTYDGVFSSSNYGASWAAMTLPFSGVIAIASSADGTKIYMATYNQIYLSTDSGISWNEINSGFSNIQDLASSADGTKLILTAYNTIWGNQLEANAKTYISNNSGLSWLPVRTPYFAIDNVASSADGNKLFISYSNNIYVSNDLGTSWSKIISPGYINDFTSSADGNKLFTVADGALYKIDIIEKPAVPGYSWLTYSTDDSIKNVSGKIVNPNSKYYGSPHYTSLPINSNSSFFVSGAEGSALNITDKLVYFDGSSLDWINQVNKPKSICMMVKKYNPQDNNSQVFFSTGDMHYYRGGMVLGSLGDSLVFSSYWNLNNSWNYYGYYPWNGLVYPHFFKDSNWKQVCLVDEGLDKNIALYGDGVLLRSKISGSDTYTIWPNYYNTGHMFDAFFGGVSNDRGDIQSKWKGEIDEAMFWSQALSADEVKSLYSSYSIPDNSKSADISNYCLGISGNNIVLDGNNQEISSMNNPKGAIKVFDSSGIILKNVKVSNSSFGILVQNSKAIELKNNIIFSNDFGLSTVYSDIVNFSGNTLNSKNSKSISLTGSSFDFNLNDRSESNNLSVERSLFFVYSGESGVRLPPLSFEDSTGFNHLNGISVRDKSFELKNTSNLYSELKGETVIFEINSVENIPHFGNRNYPFDIYGNSIVTKDDTTYFNEGDRGFCPVSDTYYRAEDGITFCNGDQSYPVQINSQDKDNRGYFDKPFKLGVTIN